MARPGLTPLARTLRPALGARPFSRRAVARALYHRARGGQSIWRQMDDFTHANGAWPWVHSSCEKLASDGIPSYMSRKCLVARLQRPKRKCATTIEFLTKKPSV